MTFLAEFKDVGNELGRLQVGLGQVATSLRAGSTEVLTTNGLELQRLVMSRAPVKTGDYRRSISLEITGAGIDQTATVGTNKPQGPRLEFGFHGPDSLGRVYDQDAQPHFGPSVDEVGPKFQADLLALAGKVIEDVL